MIHEQEECLRDKYVLYFKFRTNRAFSDETAVTEAAETNTSRILAVDGFSNRY